MEDYSSSFYVLLVLAFLVGVVMTAGVLITCKCLKK